jgi:hypothetical protein
MPIERRAEQNNCIIDTEIAVFARRDTDGNNLHSSSFVPAVEKTLPFFG